MQSHIDKISENKTQSASNHLTNLQAGSKSTFQLQDNRSKSVVQKKQVDALANRQGNKPLIQKKENNTGLPNQLKTGVENLSGHSMDDVNVHYNSDKPAQLNAHAYAQGAEIHIASGQEKHLPHEAWHVAQQKQGRVRPTTQMKGKVNVNDDKGLEKEADVMGAKAEKSAAPIQRKVKWVSGDIRYDNNLAHGIAGQGPPYMGFTNPLINGESMLKKNDFVAYYRVPEVQKSDERQKEEDGDVTATMKITEVPVVNLGYRMHLPTRGEWNIKVSKDAATVAIAKFDRSKDTSGLAEEVELIVKGVPSNTDLVIHTLDHEFQHVFIMLNHIYHSLWDFDKKLEGVKDRSFVITAPSYDLNEEYWDKAIGGSPYRDLQAFHGALDAAQAGFHQTPAGSYPKPIVEIVAPNKVLFKVDAT